MNYKEATLKKYIDPNFEPSSVNRFTANCCVVTEKAQRSVSEDDQSNKLAVGQRWMSSLPETPRVPKSIWDRDMIQNCEIKQTQLLPGAKVLIANVKAGLTKGAVTATDVLIAGKTGHASSEAARKYASDFVYQELIGTGDGKTLVFTPTLARKPAIAGSIRITHVVGAATKLGTDDGLGAITGTNIAAGVVSSYTAGTLSLTFTVAPDNATPIYASVYRFNVEKDSAGIGSLDFEVVEEDVNIETFAIRADMSVFAAINYQKLYGMNLSEEVAKFATQEVNDIWLPSCRNVRVNKLLNFWDIPVSGTIRSCS